MNIKRKLALAVLCGSGIAVAGCQSPSSGGLAFWKKDGGSSIASASPDVGRQKYDGLAKEFGGNPTTASALGGPKTESNENFLTASWKKTTGAVAGAFATKPQTSSDIDPLRLDQPAKKLGPEVHVGAAQLMENQGKFAEAERHYQEALKIAPNDINALVGLARMHDRQGDSKQAVEIYQRALKVHPQSGLVLNDLGLCYARQRQFDGAVAALNRAVELSPENAKYRNNLATVLVEMGRIDEAIAKMSMGSSPAIAHYNVGYLLQQKGQTAEATRMFQRALAIDPSLAPAQQMLAQLGGNFGAQPLAQPAPQVSPQPTYTAQAPPASQGYGVPQIEVPTATSVSAVPQGQGYHLSDDAAPPATGSTQWGSYATQHLPPVQ